MELGIVLELQRVGLGLRSAAAQTESRHKHAALCKVGPATFLQGYIVATSTKFVAVVPPGSLMTGWIWSSWVTAMKRGSSNCSAGRY